jgi:hypothetical protein
MAGNVRNLSGGWRILSPHRQKNDTVQTDTRVLKLQQGIASRSEARTCHEQVDAADDAMRFERPDLGNDATKLALAVRKMNGHMHFLGRRSDEVRDRLIVAKEEAIGRERAEQNAAEGVKDVEHASVSKRLAAAERDRPHPVTREIAHEGRDLVRREQGLPFGMASAVTEPACLGAPLSELYGHPLNADVLTNHGSSAGCASRSRRLIR